MNWQAFRIVFQAKSPIHIGYHKLGFIQRTRRYLPGRVFWRAVAARLVLEFRPQPARGVYDRVGELVRENLIFSYFYPALDPSHPLIPRFPLNQEGTIHYGSVEKGMEQGEFDSRFICSYGSTALTPLASSAEEASLHEMEFFLPTAKRDQGSQPVQWVGYLFAKAVEGEFSIGFPDRDLVISYRERFLDTRKLLDFIQIGGERRYGYGLLSLSPLQGSSRVPEGRRLWDIYPLVSLSGEAPVLKIPVGKGTPAHLYTEGDSISLQGELEPLVGREWDNRERGNGAGRNLQAFGGEGRVYWIPGSLNGDKEEIFARIRPYGLLEVCANEDR